jgi:excisionase family DNA binding protein
MLEIPSVVPQVRTSDAVPRILTVEDVAELLRVPKTWVYEHSRKRGMRRIPHKKLGKYLRFTETEVRAWFDRLPGN